MKTSLWLNGVEIVVNGTPQLSSILECMKKDQDPETCHNPDCKQTFPTYMRTRIKLCSGCHKPTPSNSIFRADVPHWHCSAYHCDSRLFNHDGACRLCNGKRLPPSITPTHNDNLVMTDERGMSRTDVKHADNVNVDRVHKDLPELLCTSPEIGNDFFYIFAIIKGTYGKLCRLHNLTGNTEKGLVNGVINWMTDVDKCIKYLTDNHERGEWVVCPFFFVVVLKRVCSHLLLLLFF